MAHTHDVIDYDNHFVIDPVTRAIDNKSGKLILMQNDHNSERFTFEIPRYVEGHDMTLCNVVQIHYNNISSNRRYQNSDIYPVTDVEAVKPDPEIEDAVETCIGSWLVSMNATTFDGTLEFIVRFACVDSKGTIEYQWFSNIYNLIQVDKGIYNIDVVSNYDDKDILAQWKQEILNAAMRQTVSLIDSAQDTLDELNKKISGTEFSINFETGDLEYTSPNYNFTVNYETGNLEWEVA